MAVSSWRAVLLVSLLAAATLAGCLGDDEEVLPQIDLDDDVAMVETGPLRMVTGNGTFVVPRLPGEARDLPDVRRLGQLDHWRTDAGAMRLLTDGQAFVLMVDQSVAPYSAGTYLFARVYGAEDNETLAVGMWQVPEGEVPLRVPVALVPSDVLRVGRAYAYEVAVFAPTAAPDCDCSIDVKQVDGLAMGTVMTDHVSHTPPRTGQWNATLIQHRVAPLSFRASWQMTFDGPTEGTDQPNAVENAPFMTPETGTYTFTFTGERVWLVDILFDLGYSKVHDTRPFARGNGSTSLQLQLDGWRPLDAYRNMSAAKGLEQSFTLALDVDFETSDDLPGQTGQTFFVTAAVGYRFGGSTYVAGTDGRSVDVLVTSGA